LLGWEDASALWLLYAGGNCLIGFDPALASWLDATASDDWTNQSATCPPPPICTQVTDISLAECVALVDIYNNNNGTNWTNNTGWGTSTTVCDNLGNGWYGVTCTNNSVISLLFSANNLTGTATFNGSNLPNLNYLDLSSNQLTSFDATGLTNIGAIALSYNQLTSFSATGLTNL
jgi:hypothetical protein